MRGRHLTPHMYSQKEYVAEIDYDIKVAQETAQTHADAGAHGTAAMMRDAADEYLDERSRFTR